MTATPDKPSGRASGPSSPSFQFFFPPSCFPSHLSELLRVRNMSPWRLVLLHHPVISFSQNLLGSNLDWGGRPVLHQDLATHGYMCLCGKRREGWARVVCDRQAPQRTEIGVAVMMIYCLLGLLSNVHSRTKAADSIWVELRTMATICARVRVCLVLLSI